jgi:hypothetical protein
MYISPTWVKNNTTLLKEISPKEMELFSTMYDDFSDGLMTAELDLPTGMIKAEVETPEYELSRQLGAAMLRYTIQFYQNKQVENAKTTFENTSKRVDSISTAIVDKQRMIAESQDVNIFNKKRENVVGQQKLMQDLATLSVLYNDANMSKENAKVGLTPQNNIVRIVDDPMFSTAPKYLSKLLYTAIGIVASLILVIIPLMLSKAVQDGREEDRLRLAKQQGSVAP